MARNTDVSGQTFSEDEWETVAEQRSRIVFDEDGDTWTGTYEGVQEVPDPENAGEFFTYLNFRGDDNEGYQMSASYMLRKAFINGNIPAGTYVKITRTGTTAAKHGTMTNFKVQTRR